MKLKSSRFNIDPPKDWGVSKYPDSIARKQEWSRQCYPSVLKELQDRYSSLKRQRKQRLLQHQVEAEKREKQAQLDSKIRKYHNYITRVALLRLKVKNSFSQPKGLKTLIGKFQGTYLEHKQLERERTTIEEKRRERAQRKPSVMEKPRERYERILNKRLKEKVLAMIPDKWCKHVEIEIADEPSIFYREEVTWPYGRNYGYPKKYDVLVVACNRRSTPQLFSETTILMDGVYYTKGRGHTISQRYVDAVREKEKQRDAVKRVVNRLLMRTQNVA